MNNQEQLKQKIKILRIIMWSAVAIMLLSLICVLATTKNLKIQKIFGWFFVISIIVGLIAEIPLKKAKKEYKAVRTISKAIEDNIEKQQQIYENKKSQREKVIREYEENQQNKTKVIRNFTLGTQNDYDISQEYKNENQEFYNKQINKCSKSEKIFYDTLYKRYGEKYNLEAQVYLRSMFPRMGADNDIIDIVFRHKYSNNPILLIEINDESHNRNKLRKMRDKDLKAFCAANNIKLQFLWTRYGCNEKSVYNLIDKKLSE